MKLQNSGKCLSREYGRISYRRPGERRDLPCCMSSHGCAPPGLAGLEYGVGEDDESPEHGDEGNFGRLALGDEALVKGAQHGIVPAGGDGCGIFLGAGLGLLGDLPVCELAAA